MGNVKKFQKVVEDFICENCGEKIIGDGFTNHCPKCFYSKHVDIFPGDRLENCHGLMEPIDVLIEKNDKYIILHKCQKCGEISKDRFREKTDNFEKLLELIKKINLRKENRI